MLSLVGGVLGIIHMKFLRVHTKIHACFNNLDACVFQKSGDQYIVSHSLRS